MAESGGEKAASGESKSFASLFHTIVDGYREVGTIAKLGASVSLLATGMVMLAAAIAIKVLAGVKIDGWSVGQMSTGDLAVLVSGSVVLLVGGSGVQIWDRLMDDKANERRVRLRMEAAGKAAAVLPFPPRANLTRTIQ